MKKRIRRHQVRLGMFVEEFEAQFAKSGWSAGFQLATPADVERVLGSNVISLVIDTARGADVDPEPRVSGVDAAQQAQADLLRRFSADEIVQARETINETLPVIQELFSDARMHGIMKIGQAKQAARHVVAAAKTNVAALFGISRLKNKDQVTYLHSLAVSALMVTFASRLNLDPETIDDLAVAGLVHDIGKMALPDAVLLKSGGLSDDEFAVIKTHPQRGHQILARFENMPSVALQVCLAHHEKFDGSGYPHHLAGEAIPFAARLATICDVYEALTTVRPYKRAWSQSEAVHRMLLATGHFDPRLLSKFVSLVVIAEAI